MDGSSYILFTLLCIEQEIKYTTRIAVLIDGNLMFDNESAETYLDPASQKYLKEFLPEYHQDKDIVNLEWLGAIHIAK